jgi:WD40 repeat protein/DNA-binding SARP family transcriptional activator
MEFRILGPLEVIDRGRVVRLGEGRQRALLALLLLRSNQVISSDRLVEELWDDGPTPTAPKMLQKYVWQLRTTLDDRALDRDSQRVVTRGQGYLLHVGPDELDATRFERLLADGRRARAAGRPDAAEALRDALALWRGPALEEFADRSFARADIARLEEMRLTALEERISVDLDLGRHAEVIAELEALVAAQPLRERFRSQLMLALYRSDRQAEALRVYRDTHRMFGEELGLDPSPELQRLERSILAQDPSLEWKPRAATAMAAPPAPGEPPYRGLEYFDVKDSAWFFGRERLTARLLDRARATRLLAVVGASGSGKSSLVRAGLVASRDRDDPSGRRGIVITPTAHPLQALATGLSSAGRSSRSTSALVEDLTREPRTLHLVARRLAGRGRRQERDRILLVVDQFEELFTLCRDEQERSAFVANLMTAAALGGPIAVVIALRADFYAHLAAYSDLRSAVAEEQEYIGPMTADELRRTITGPAEQGDWRLGPGLVDLILHDLEDAPGALPLLSHALLETWHRRRGRELTVEGYGEAGGVRRAIAFTADRLFHDELDLGERAIGRRLLLRLTELGDGTADTRRRVALRELIPEAPPEARAASTRVLNRLTEARLVTTGENTAEVAHEALIREWPTLHGWLSEDREGLRTHRQITEAADQWEAMERDPGALYRGTRLARATDWVAAHPDTLNDREMAFIAESDVLARREEVEREEQHQRELEAAEQLADAERRRAEQAAASAGRLRRRAIALTGALGLAAVLGVAALAFGLQARDSLANADSQRLGAEANGILQRGESAELAALLAIRGIRSQYTAQADSALQRASRQQFSDRIITTPQRVDGFAVSADGHFLLAGSGDGDVRLVDVDSGEVIHTFPGATDYIPDVDFSPDGTLVAAIDVDGLRLWDVATGTERWSLPVGTQDVTFSPDGRSLALLLDGAASLLDVEDGHVLQQVTIPDAGGLFLAPDGRTAFATAGATGSLWDLETGMQLREFIGHTARIANAAFSADGRLVATSSNDETARIWDVATGTLLQTLAGHTEIVFQSAFSPDGSLLLTGSLDNSARLWDVATGAELRKFAGHTAAVYSVGFTTDGTHALTTGKDGTIRFWDVRAPIERDTLGGPTSFMYAVDYSPDGKLVFAGNADGTSQLWEVATQRVTHVLFDDARVNVAAFSPDGRYVLTAAEGHPAELWDVSTGALAAALEGSGGAEAADFSRDGRVMVASAGENRIGVWDVATRKLIRAIEPDEFSAATISPDGTRLLTFRDFAGVPNAAIWDVATGDKLREFEQPIGILDGIFSPDGRTVLATGRDNVARLWDVATAKLVREFRGHTNIMWRGAFSPDGRYVFTTSQDKSARMWDVQTGQQIRYFPGHALSAVAGIAVSPDGEQVAIGSYDGFIQLAPTDRDALLDSVCQRLRRDLDDAERTIYGITDPGPTCT